MTELNIPARGGGRLKGVPGTELERGRNNPLIGLWLLDNVMENEMFRTVVDPMCGPGQLWLNAIASDPRLKVYGCDINPDCVRLALANGIRAEEDWAQEYVPDLPDPLRAHDLICFSPIYPQNDHDSGKGEKQTQMVQERGAHAMQKIEGTRNLLPVFLHLQTYRAGAPIAVIARNAIENQVEVDWVSEIEASMVFAGLGPIERFFYSIPPGMTEQWKKARNPRHRVITREWILLSRSPEVH